MITKSFIMGWLVVGLILTCCYPVNTQISKKAGNEPIAQLSASQKSLVEGSKKALLKTGMSEPYFNEHFRLIEVFNKPGDRRVVWRFFINGYETTINDSIGHYTEGSKQIDIHSVENTLSSTTDIQRTIPKSRAFRIMRSCLGKFTDSSIEYRASGSGKAELVLVASSVPRSIRRSQEARERKERDREGLRKKATQAGGKAETDIIMEEDEDGSPVYIGSVNLETGKCTKGRAQAGPPKTNLLLPLN